MSNIFISHSSKDKVKINALAESLKLLGCEVFYSSDALTNKIGYGSDFYEDIRKEISQSDVVLFMVSQNFYNSIPSLIEIGIAYSLGKKMIPIGFKSGNYKENLKGVFNSNQRLACLDDEDCVIDLLDDLASTKDFKLMNKCKKNILSTVVDSISKDIENNEGIVDYEISVSTDEMLEDDEEITSDIIKKLKNLNEMDYIFLTYIVKSRTYKFVFANDPEYWQYQFENWLKINQLDEKTNCEYRGFLNYLDLKGLLINTSWSAELSEFTVDALEFIYDRDREKINNILDNCTNDIIPF